MPRNLFPLDVDAPKTLLFAGGIGITPILAMSYALKQANRCLDLHYTVREPQNAAFVDEMKKAFGDSLHLYADTGQDVPEFSVLDALQGVEIDTHIYCSGLTGFMNHVEAVALDAGWDAQNLHFEKFAGGAVDATGSFQILARKSGLTLNVPEGKTILETLLDAGVDVPFSCESGVCGTCLCDVLDGTPDDKDSCQSDKEKASNTRIAVCCSSSKSNLLILNN